jgi:hypothetical protein
MSARERFLFYIAVILKWLTNNLKSKGVVTRHLNDIVRTITMRPSKYEEAVAERLCNIVYKLMDEGTDKEVFEIRRVALATAIAQYMSEKDPNKLRKTKWDKLATALEGREEGNAENVIADEDIFDIYEVFDSDARIVIALARKCADMGKRVGEIKLTEEYIKAVV